MIDRTRTAAELADEYRPSMDKDVLHSWAQDAVKHLRSGGAAEPPAPADEATPPSWVAASLHPVWRDGYAAALCVSIPPEPSEAMVEAVRREERNACLNIVLGTKRFIAPGGTVRTPSDALDCAAAAIQARTPNPLADPLRAALAAEAGR